MKRRNSAVDEDEEEAQEEEKEQPPRKMTRNIGGQKREYHFLKTVNSMEELEKFRFEVIVQKPKTNEIINLFRITAQIRVSKIHPDTRNLFSTAQGEGRSKNVILN
jgi:hypothetical protein